MLESRPPTLTIGVLTKNEAHHITQCLHSAAFADQLLVIDSGSTDATVALARQAGAEVHVYPDWQGFALQRNRVLAHARGDYLFYLDADEVITPALRAEIEAAVRSGARAVWQIQWRVVAYGRELKYFLAQSTVERMFRRDMLSHYEGVVHEHAVLHPEPGGAAVPRHVLRAKLLHYSRETVHGSLVKLTQYAMLGAAKRDGQGRQGGIWRGLGSALAIFVRLYVLRLGFLGGGAGFLFCTFIALESFFRYVALKYDQGHLSESVER